MPADVELARREGVELVNTGTWRLLSGAWSPNRKDILAAVEASKCPAVRRPRLKLGHLDERFNEPDDKVLDGTPALGWFDNLRASADGETLVGDQVALPWLTAVQPAAWPDRSIEGKRNAVCALGHTHPFMVTAVSLLGETPPGIPTLKSIKALDDLPAALGIAAAGEVAEGGEDVQAFIHAAAEVHTGAMIALIPSAEDAERLAVEGGEPANELHLTLAYLGEAADLGARGKQDVIDHVSTVANGLPRLEAEIYAVNVFNPGDAQPERDTCLVWGVTGDMLDAVHEMVDDILHLIDAPIPSQHRPWAAHITAAYTDDLGRIAELATKVGPIAFDRLRLAFGGEFIDIPLMEWPGEEPEPVDDPMLVAAAAGGADSLHNYWTKGAGLAKWRGKPHPWTALFNQLKKHLGADKAKRTASKWFLEVMGHTPNQKGVKASEEPATTPTPILPAAEPEQPITDPKEDLVSTELSGIRSRLGLDDTADEQAILSALDALKSKADTPAVAEPTPEMVAASAAAVEKASLAEAEKDELRKEVSVLASQMQQVTTELSAAKAAQAATVKASVFDAAVKDGKLKPADREQWEKDYDEAPGAITRVLASIAPGTAVPVMASGHTGPAEPVGNDMAEFEAAMARLDGPISKAV